MKMVNRCWKCGAQTENPVGWNKIVLCDLCAVAYNNITVSNTSATSIPNESTVSSTTYKKEVTKL